MPIITRLVQGKKNPNRVNLYFDDKFFFALSIDEVAKYGLKRGLELTPESIEKLKDNDETDYVYAKILNFLSYRPRTIKEVRDRLYKYDIKDESKQKSLIDVLQSKGHLDDLVFARWFVESRNTHRPRSKRYLSAELKAKGVSDEIIKQVAGQIGDENQTIREILTKKLGSSRKLEIKEKQKILGYLGRQGFAWDKIIEVVKSWESE